MKIKGDYSSSEVEASIKELGIREKDILFVTTGLGFLGRPANCFSLEQLCELHLKVLQSSVSKAGGIIVPTYSYTFGETTPEEYALFDPKVTQSKIGPFPNYVLNQTGFKRSSDPMMSVAAWGERAVNLIERLPCTSYGKDSIYERLLIAENSKCISIGLGPNWTPFIHYLDYVQDAEYRYDKLFIGKIVGDNNNIKPVVWHYSVAAKLDEGSGNCQKLGYLAKANNIWTKKSVGKSSIYCAKYSQYYEFARLKSHQYQWITTKNKRQNVRDSEERRLKKLRSEWKEAYPQEVDIDTREWKFFNKIFGQSLLKIFKSLKKTLLNASIDYIDIETGSNISDFIIPEAIYPIGLNIRTKNKILINSQDEMIISKIVLPNSTSYSSDAEEFLNKLDIDGKLKDSNQLKEIDYIYNATVDKSFRLTDLAVRWLKNELGTNKKAISITYTSETFFSGVECIIITPNKDQERKIRTELICIDTLQIDHGVGEDFLLNKVAQLIDNDKSIIFAPLFFAQDIFMTIHPECQIKNLRLKENMEVEEFTKPNLLINKNPCVNTNKLKINTLEFCST